MDKNIILSRKLQNAVKQKFDGDLTFFLRNIVINGEKRGCSGFIRNNQNNTYVYVSTETIGFLPLGIGYLYRLADNEKDFTDYRNRYSDSLKNLVENIVNLLNSSIIQEKDTRI